MRGKLDCRFHFPNQLGSIPACAGEACTAGWTERPAGVYPRVCGGSGGSVCCGYPASGLSPRVRGKRGEEAAAVGAGGSIPACAGEAVLNDKDGLVVKVYPRVCGGSQPNNCGGYRMTGLSPRVRGKLWERFGRVDSYRSIPACAGEAESCRGDGLPNEVYPRVCGGSLPRHPVIVAFSGLSPRVRGKPPGTTDGRRPRRSIPACAGEACGLRNPDTWARVYPRVCGGSGYSWVVNTIRMGLSPRVRGKRRMGLPGPPGRRSIPACAGEASIGGGCAAGWGVYPRVCGGSRPGRGGRKLRRGLSPRVRGKRKDDAVIPATRRSIPACAGEAR